MIPEASPGRSIPVGAPKPKFLAQYAGRSIPSMPASWKKNVSLEWANPSLIGMGPQPRWFQSQNRVDPSVRNGRVVTSEVAVILWSLRAPEPVTSLKVDPGG